MKEKLKPCYGWDEQLGICLLYGVYCEANIKKDCYHKNQKEAFKKGLFK